MRIKHVCKLTDSRPGIRLELETDMKIESLNKFMGRSRYAWRNYKKDWETALYLVDDVEKVKRKSFVTVIRYSKDRRGILDKENRYGGAKPIRDLLIKRGWLWDDTDEWSDLSVFQGIRKAGDLTYIRVDYQPTDLPDMMI